MDGGLVEFLGVPAFVWFILLGVAMVGLGAAWPRSSRLDEPHAYGAEARRRLPEHGQPGIGHGQEGPGLQREQRVEPAVAAQRVDGPAVAAANERRQLARSWCQDARGGVGGGVQRLAHLSVAAAGEALLRLASGGAAPVDEPRADLRGDEAVAVEDAAGVAAEPYEEDTDAAVAQRVRGEAGETARSLSSGGNGTWHSASAPSPPRRRTTLGPVVGGDPP